MKLIEAIRKYLGEVAQELQKVTWPTREQTINMTLLVIGVSAVVALYISGLDIVFGRLVTLLLTK